MPLPRRIPPEEWEEHKSRIIDLWLDQRLTLSRCSGRDGLIETMEKEGFIATKSQYEARFRVWHVRKNMSAGEWRRAISDIQESRQRGKPHSIRLSGRALSSSRVDKARRRYRTRENPTSPRAPSDNTPRDNVFPVSLDDESTPVEEVTCEEKSLPPLLSIEETPSLSMNEGLGNFDFGLLNYNTDNATADTLVNSSTQGSTSEDLAMEADTLFSNPLNLNVSYPLDVLSGSVTATPGLDQYHPMFPSFSTVTVPSNVVTQLATCAASSTACPNFDGNTLRLSKQFPREWWIGPLPSVQLMSLASKGISRMNLAPTNGTVSGFTHFHLVTQLFSDLSGLLDPDIEERDFISTFSNALISLASKETFIGEEQNQFAILSNDDVFESRFCGRLIKSMMNGFTGLEDIPVAGILRFLYKQHPTRSLLIQFLSYPTCEAKSLAEGLFQAALSADDIETVKLLLQLRLVDTNGIICFATGDRRTPLEAAAEKQSFKVLKHLLGLNVDVNKSAKRPHQLKYGTFLPLSYECSYPLHSLIHHYHDRKTTLQQNFLQLVDDFLSAGAMIPEVLMSHVFQKFVDVRLANLLVYPFISQCKVKSIPAAILIDIIENLEECDATRTIKLILDEYHEWHLYHFHEELSTALTKAIARRYLELVKVLLPCTISLDNPFRSAIKNRNQEAIDIILKRSPDLDKEINEITPLSAALESQNQELVLLLEKRGVLDRLGEKEISIAITAALRVGNLMYADKLLDLELDADGSLLRGALHIAVAHNFDELAWRLLANGAHITISTSIEYPSSLFIATKKRKLSMVRAMLQCWPQETSFGAAIDGENALFEAIVDLDDCSILTDFLQYYSCGSRHRNISGIKRVLEKANHDVFWTIIKSIPYTLRGLALRCALQVAVKQEDTLLLGELFDFGALPDDNEVLAEAVMEHPSMIKPLLSRFCQVYPGGLYEETRDILERARANFKRYSDFSRIILVLELVHPNSLLFDFFDGLIQSRNNLQWTKLQELEFSKQLLDSGCDVNTDWLRDHIRKNPLLIAIETANIDMVHLLVEHGARVNMPSQGTIWQTPLQRAVEVDSLEIVRFLLQKGANVNASASRYHGGTALQFAAIVGNCTIATELIEHGARFDSPPSWGKEGRWPLEGAAEKGRIDMIQLLWYANSGQFDDKQCRKAIRRAEKNGRIGCRDKIVELMSTRQLTPITGPPMSWEDFPDIMM